MHPPGPPKSSVCVAQLSVIQHTTLRLKTEPAFVPALFTDSYDPRYAEIHSGHATPDSAFPDVEDDDSDPNYARINNFRQPPSPQSFVSRSPSPSAQAGPNPPLASSEELDGLYAKVNKTRPSPALQNQQQTQADR